MKPVTKTGTIGAAYGNKLDKELPLSFSYDSFETADEVRSEYKPKELDELIIGAANAAASANARAKATETVLSEAGIKKPDTSTPEYARSEMVKNLMKAKGLDKATAEQIVNGIMGA